MRDFWLGIAPEHRVGLLCLLASPPLLLQIRRWRAAAPEDRWCSGLLGTLAVVHLGLPVWFGSVLSAGLFGWLAVRCLAGRSWRVQSGFLVTAQLLLFVAASGVRAATADQVALTVAVLELALLSVSCPAIDTTHIAVPNTTTSATVPTRAIARRHEMDSSASSRTATVRAT